MKKIAIIGAGGFGREVKMLIDQINAVSLKYEFIGYYDDGKEKGTLINNFPVLGKVSDLNSLTEEVCVVIAIGDPEIKQKIVSKLNNTFLFFETLIHPKTIIGTDSVFIGQGCVICAGSILTCNITIGNFVIINLVCTIGHDSVINNFCSLMPAVNISGEVVLEKAVYVGTGVTIINQILIGQDTIIGAGAVIVKNIPKYCTVVGNPGKVIKQRNYGAFSVIEVDNPKWNEVLNKCKFFDFCHTQTYHKLEKEHRAVLFVADFDDIVIAMPLLIRKIPNTQYFDCTSVYGYSGPISTLDFSALSKEMITFFTNNLNEFFTKNNIISAFSRLHPLISYSTFFDNFGQEINSNNTIAVDLELPESCQIKQYRKSIKNDIKRLYENKFEVVEASTKDEISKFVLLYHQNMERLNAKSNYYFEDLYFSEILNNKCFNTKLLLVKFQGEIVSGALFTITNNIMQYHLAATSENFLKWAPMKLIIDKAREMGNLLQLKYLHLGGGVAGASNDSLFFFKSGFSKVNCQFNVWQKIVNLDVYNLLCENTTNNSNTKFFPRYRCN